MEYISLVEKSLDMLTKATRGFGCSIAALGLARTWLSLMTGLLSGVPTSLDLGGFDWVRGAALIAASAVLSLAPPLPDRLRPKRVWFGAAGALLYLISLVCGATGALAVGFSALYMALFCLMLRFWCDDNCSADFRAVLVRLCLSFFAQYVCYATVLIAPPAVQQMCAALLPLVVMGLLSVRVGHAPAGESPGEAEKGGARFSALNVVCLVFIVVLHCMSHGLLFKFSEAVSGSWVLGSAMTALVTLAAVMAMRSQGLFKGFVCVTLTVQCLCVLVTLAFGRNTDWISLAKSMSYVVSMLLAASTGVYLASLRGDRAKRGGGAYAMRWMCLYFASFYATSWCAALLLREETPVLIAVLVCLVGSAILTLGNEWPRTPSGLSLRALSADRDAEGRVERCATSRALEQLAVSAGLTPKEAGVLRMVADGETPRAIAQECGVSVNTVRTQVQAVYRKLGVHSRAELADAVETVARTLP